MSLRMRHRITKQVRVRRNRREQKRWPAHLGDGAGTVEVPGHPNLWYVRPVGSDIAMAVYRGSAPRLHDYPVWVGQDVYNRRWTRILGINMDELAGGSTTISEVGPHGESHGLADSDPIWVDVRQVLNVLAYASTGMIVHVNAGWVIIDGQPVKIISTNIDMTASIPGSGAAYSIIRASSTGALSVVDGTPVASLLDLDDSDAPAFADGYAAIALVRLWFGMTELSRSSTQPDVTPLYLAQLSRTGSATPTAHHETHESGGDDEIKLDDLGTPDDNTDLDATVTEHGLLPKLSGSVTDMLLGDGTWGSGAGSRVSTLAGDGAWCWFADPRAIYKVGSSAAA